MAEQRRIAVAGGGTAGHIYPALSLADAYRKARQGVDILFIGTPGGFESRLVPRHGYLLEMVQGSPLFGVGPRGRLGALKSLAVGTMQARRLLKASGSQLAIGFGGYASAGAIIAARSLGLKTVIHEANLVPGLTNRALGRIVDRVYIGFEKAGRAFPRESTTVIGNPIRPEIAAVGRERGANARSPARILVTGGSLGSTFLNRNAPGLLGRLGMRGLCIEVLHQTGEEKPDPVQTAYDKAGISATVVPYIDRMPDAYRWADFAIACSGSLTVAELSASRLPALLVPLSGSAGDHQSANAMAFAGAGAGIWTREEEWELDTLSERVTRLLTNPDAWRNASQSASRLATPDAASRIVADCEAMMRDR